MATPKDPSLGYDEYAGAPPVATEERQTEWVLVPREPTKEMLRSAIRLGGSEAHDPEVGYSHVYRAMLSAAPPPPVTTREAEDFVSALAATVQQRTRARMREGATADDYRKAVDGEGEFGSLGYEWSDKPHRLVYDLCGEVEHLQSLIDSAVSSAIERCAKVMDSLADELSRMMSDPADVARALEYERAHTWVTSGATSIRALAPVRGTDNG
jgi:hypothetical protein